MAKIKDISGRRYGRLVVLGSPEIIKSGAGQRTVWLCQCDCGNSTRVSTGNLTSGGVVSCGCRRREVLNRTKHGCEQHELYNTWRHMMQRCYQTDHPTYRHYGGRGIRVCRRWHDISKFITDMAPRPPGTSLDRIDNDGPYSPRNCRWSSPTEQQNNKRTNRLLLFRGEKKTMSQWAREVGMPVETLFARLKKMPIESALITPRREKGTSK